MNLFRFVLSSRCKYICLWCLGTDIATPSLSLYLNHHINNNIIQTYSRYSWVSSNREDKYTSQKHHHNERLFYRDIFSNKIDQKIQCRNLKKHDHESYSFKVFKKFTIMYVLYGSTFTTVFSYLSWWAYANPSGRITFAFSAITILKTIWTKSTFWTF